MIAGARSSRPCSASRASSRGPGRSSSFKGGFLPERHGLSVGTHAVACRPGGGTGRTEEVERKEHSGYKLVAAAPGTHRAALSPPSEGAAAGRPSDTVPPRACLLRQRIRAGLGDLRILFGRRAGHADRADNFAVHLDRDPALERASAAQSQQPEVGATLADEVLEHLGGTPVEDRRVRLVLGCFDAAELRAVHALEHHEMAARIEDGNDHVPLVLLRLGLCAEQHLLGLLEVDWGAVGNLGRRRRHRLLSANRNRREQQYRHDNQRQKPCDTHGVSSYWKADVEGMTAADDMAAWGAERVLRPALPWFPAQSWTEPRARFLFLLPLHVGVGRGKVGQPIYCQFAGVLKPRPLHGAHDPDRLPPPWRCTAR